MHKVEPPNWWAGHSINPVRVLIRGENLRGARLASKFPVSRISCNSAGTYLFADLLIPRAAKPGSYPLRVRTAGGSAQAAFEVTAKLRPADRFQGFGPEDVMYLIMPDRFVNGDPSNDNPPKAPGMTDRSKPRFYHGGDLQGVIHRLPYLRDLGITAIWLNPVYDNYDKLHSGRREPFTDYHGYGAVDFYAVDEHLGDIATLRELVDKAHAHGIKVIQDQVANHTGPTHPWVADPPTPTWFNGTAREHAANSLQMWTLIDPYTAPRAREEALRGWFVNLLPDLNQDDQEVRRYIIQNTLWWTGMTGLDGIRQDTLPFVGRRFWADWMAAIRREHPRLTVVGEVFDQSPAVVAFFQGGHAPQSVDTRIDTVFDFPLFFEIRSAFLAGAPLGSLPAMLAHDVVYPNPSVLVTFLGLHDVPRFMSEKAATTDALKLAFTFLLTTRGTPLIYYGDEIAMEGGGDPDNRRDFPAEPTREGAAVLEHVRKLTRIRKDVIHGPLQNLLASKDHYVYRRGTAVVGLNNGSQPADLRFAIDARGAADDRLGGPARLMIENGQASVRIPAKSGAIFVLSNR